MIFVLPGEGLRIFPGAATSACSKWSRLMQLFDSGQAVFMCFD
jgi:hypothetical protein